LLFGFILVCGWMLAGAVDMGAIVHLKKFNMEAEDNLYARKHVTQTRILQRVAAILIGLITLGLALLTIPGVKQWGLSLLASAGVVGIVAGLALQPFLTNLIAGIQIATAQPIRLTHAGPAEQGLAYIAWPTTDAVNDRTESRRAAILAEVLKLRVLDEIREKQALAYSPSVRSSASDVFQGYGSISITADTAIASSRLRPSKSGRNARQAVSSAP
ncbi:hypothetical protein LTR94_030094, partial [Friedmanniomyces endolithicus]